MKKRRKKKKGFTLIELLAVILILGIIALIAIPTVNNILNESRFGAFKSTVNQVAKSIESNCQIENIKSEEINEVYTITDGQMAPSIDIKGELPSTGYFMVNNDCELTFYTDDGKFMAQKTEFEEEIDFKQCENGKCDSAKHFEYAKKLDEYKDILLAWFEDKQEYLPQPGESIFVDLGSLEAMGVFPIDTKNPVTNECINDGVDFRLINENGKYKLEFNFENQYNGSSYCESKEYYRVVIFKGYPNINVEIAQNSTFDHLGVVSFNIATGQVEDISNITIKYYNPSGEEVSNIDTSITGNWKITYEYKYMKSGIGSIWTQATRYVIVK